jgi:hypothetical protein
MFSMVNFLKLPPYTLAGFDLTTRSSADRDDSTRPRRHHCNCEIANLFRYFFRSAISMTIGGTM